MNKHPFNKTKLGFKLYILKNRITSIRKDILLLALISFISILLIELWLINIPAPLYIFYSLGVIYLKLCYSFVSAFIFYYVVIHLPKEKRKLKVFRVLSNKIHLINSHVYNLMNSLFDGKLDPKDIYERTAENITDATKKINPTNAVKAINFDSASYEKILYPNWYDYLETTTESIKRLVKDILLLNESIDSNLLESLTHLEDTAQKLIFKNVYNASTIEFASHRLINIRNDSQKLFLSFGKAYNKYVIEYHILERRKNLELIKQGKL